MEALFLKLFNMSITAAWVVLAVVVLRLLLKKAPKSMICFLWLLVAIRLIFPISIESVVSLIPSTETITEESLYSDTPVIDSGINAVNDRVNPIISESLAPEIGASVNPMKVIIYVSSYVWVIGMIGMLIYAVVSYFKLWIKVREAVVDGDRIWLCDRISTPFILGIIRPRIYIPSWVEKEDKEYVIAHERAHLKRKDHWWKPLGFLLLTVYWFNPVMWLAYVLLCKDIEYACDEKVLNERGIECKKDYSNALVNCSVSRRSVAVCPLAFGEVGVKDRIKSVLSYKKPAFWVIMIALILCAVFVIVFMTNPSSNIRDMNYGKHITMDELYENFEICLNKYVINAKDALEVLKFAAKGLEDFPVIEGELTWKVGDVNADHSINAKDALDILKYSAKIINIFSIEMKLIEFKTEDIRAVVLENIENEVSLGEYKGIEVEVEKLVVTDADIQYYIDLALEMAGLTELTDEFVLSMELEGVTTVEEFKAYLRAVVEEQMGDYQKYYELEIIFGEILADSEILAYNDPELNVDLLCEEIIVATKETAKMMGVSYEEYVSTYMEMSVEDYEAELRLEYKFYVDSILVMRAIAMAENITVSQDEYNEAYAAMYEDYMLSGYESVDEYAKAVYEELLYVKVEDMIMENSVVSYR